MPDSQLPSNQPPTVGSTADPSACAPAQIQSLSDGLDRCLVMIKQGHRYLFRYQPGEESLILESLVTLVHDAECPLDWFDVAMLSHQMGRQLSPSFVPVSKS